MQEKGGEMMKLEKLKGLLVEHKRTYADLAELLGVSITTINSKMNGKTQFDVVEATMISDWLELDCSSRVDIFYTITCMVRKLSVERGKIK